MKRRSYTVRARPTSAYGTNDLGVLVDKSEESMEAKLSQQVMTLEMENEKLKTQVLSLQEQLSQRPPLEEVQEMKKEYRSLDMLMLGSQRENQRCMADLERAKDRIKTLETELAKLAGPNWQIALELPSMGSIKSTGLPSRKSLSIGSLTLHSDDGENANDVNKDPSIDDESEENPKKKKIKGDLRAYLDSVRIMILGYDDELKKRAEELSKVMELAQKEGENCRALRMEMEQETMA